MLGLFFLVLLSTSFIAAQKSLSTVNVRFSNPDYNQKTNSYCLDVELQADKPGRQLFGMNVRFFYDNSKLNLQGFSEFTEGYGILGDAPIAYLGDEFSGNALFNFDKSTAYVNSAVQLINSSTPLTLNNSTWVKCFKVCFSIISPSDQTQGFFCPSVIWDLKASPQKTGFFKGEDGVVFTILENDPVTPQVSAPANAGVKYFNWHFNGSDEMPYGSPVKESCINLSQLTSSSVSEGELKFELFQNEPNPFQSEALIGFNLPKAAAGRLHFFDAAGRTVIEIKGDFDAGFNKVKVTDIDLGAYSGGILFYQLHTRELISDIKKMIITGR